MNKNQITAKKWITSTLGLQESLVRTFGAISTCVSLSNITNNQKEQSPDDKSYAFIVPNLKQVWIFREFDKKKNTYGYLEVHDSNTKKTYTIYNNGEEDVFEHPRTGVKDLSQSIIRQYHEALDI